MNPFLEFSLFWSAAGWRERLGIKSGFSLAMAIFSLLINLANFLLVGLFLLARSNNLNFLRLHYTVVLGVDWIGEWWKIFIFAIFGLGFIVINAVMAGILGHKSALTSLVMWITTMLIEVSLLVASVFAILINI